LVSHTAVFFEDTDRGVIRYIQFVGEFLSHWWSVFHLPSIYTAVFFEDPDRGATSICPISTDPCLLATTISLDLYLGGGPHR
ncbi:Hypothetical predicted protein, partial [Pelobates cultripes]